MSEILSIANEVLLPIRDIQEIAEYLNYNEWGLAFEILCTSITDNQIVISKRQYDVIKLVGEKMDMDCGLWKDICLQT